MRAENNDELTVKIEHGLFFFTLASFQERRNRLILTMENRANYTSYIDK